MGCIASGAEKALFPTSGQLSAFQLLCLSICGNLFITSHTSLHNLLHFADEDPTELSGNVSRSHSWNSKTGIRTLTLNTIATVLPYFANVFLLGLPN